MLISHPARTAPTRLTRGASSMPPPVAWRPISLVALCTAIALLIEAAVQRFHGDELYFLAGGNHLSWGYADQGVLVPLLARMGEAAGGAPLVVRIPAVLATVVGVALAALLAREFGGRRWAQTVTAAACAASPRAVETGSLLLTQTFDIPLWIATTLLLVRWVRTRAGSLWWLMGALAGIDFLVKPLIAVFWVCCLAALLVSRYRRVLRTGLWKLGLPAVAGALPFLIWQWCHGFPELTLVPVVGQETDEFAGGPLAVLPLTLLSNGALAGAALAGYGCWALLRDARLAPYRFLGWTCVAVLAVILVAGGRYYYCAGLFPLCWAAATAHIATIRSTRWWPRVASVAVSAFSGAVVFLISVAATGPAAPAWATSATLEVRAEQGWTDLTATVAGVYQGLPRQIRDTTTIVTDHYWQASALDWYGPALGLPNAYSPHRGFSYFGEPPSTTRTVLFVGADPSALRTHCGLRSVTPTTPGLGFRQLDQGVPIWLCDAPGQSWARLRHS